MADELRADLDGLEHFAASLETARHGLETETSWMKEFAGDLGGRDVDAALAHFEADWRDGCGIVADNLERIAKLANHAVASIRSADADLARHLRSDG